MRRFALTSIFTNIDIVTLFEGSSRHARWGRFVFLIIITPPTWAIHNTQAFPRLENNAVQSSQGLLNSPGKNSTLAWVSELAFFYMLLATIAAG